MKSKSMSGSLQLIGWFVVVLGAYAWFPSLENEGKHNSVSDSSREHAAVSGVVAFPTNKSTSLRELSP